MDTGDPSGFFSSTAVFYAMLLLDYYTNTHVFKTWFIKVARLINMILAGISVSGILGILTVSDIDGGYYITFSESMRLGNQGIINVHWLFAILAIVAVIMAALEWVSSIANANAGNNVKNVKKGA